MSQSDREGLNFNKIMIKKEYIQPTVKAVKIKCSQFICNSTPREEFGEQGEAGSDIEVNSLSADFE